MRRDYTEWMERLLPVLRRAGETITRIADSGDWGVETKSDQSPVTRADRESETVVIDGLRALDASIPIVSEERAPAELSERATWRHFWCLDPLDGTKEFINRTGEFAINLALVEDRYPVFGMIHIPASGITYVGWSGGGALRVERSGDQSIIQAREASNSLVIVGSRFHSGGEASLVATRSQRDVVPVTVGSSIKFGRLAEGAADIYVRLRPTSEWDTAAGQAIVEAAGGGVYSLDGDRLVYNKADLKNPGFVAIADTRLPWRQWIENV